MKASQYPLWRLFFAIALFGASLSSWRLLLVPELSDNGRIFATVLGIALLGTAIGVIGRIGALMTLLLPLLMFYLFAAFAILVSIFGRP